MHVKSFFFLFLLYPSLKCKTPDATASSLPNQCTADLATGPN